MDAQKLLTDPERENHLLAQSILTNQLALFFNDQLKHTKFYKTALKQKLNLLIPELIKAEKAEYDVIYEKHEQLTVGIHDMILALVSELSSAGIYEFQNLLDIVRAYKKDPASIHGIAAKVNRKKDG